jgi:hypothetical protein
MYWRDGRFSLFAPPLISALSGEGIADPDKVRAWEVL